MFHDPTAHEPTGRLHDGVCAQMWPQSDVDGQDEPDDSRWHGIGLDRVAGIVLRPETPRAADRGPHDETMALLLSRIQQRDVSALASLHLLCAAKLLAIALRVTRKAEIANEAVSAALMQAWTTAASFDPQRGCVLAWLSTIVRSRTLDLVRREGVRMRHECELDVDDLTHVVDSAREPSLRLEQSQELQRLRRALAILSPMQRQVLSLTFLEGNSHEEAAAHMGLPLGTVKSHCRRGLAALRAQASLRAVRA